MKTYQTLSRRTLVLWTMLILGSGYVIAGAADKARGAGTGPQAVYLAAYEKSLQRGVVETLLKYNDLEHKVAREQYALMQKWYQLEIKRKSFYDMGMQFQRGDWSGLLGSAMTTRGYSQRQNALLARFRNIRTQANQRIDDMSGNYYRRYVDALTPPPTSI